MKIYDFYTTYLRVRAADGNMVPPPVSELDKSKFDTVDKARELNVEPFVRNAGRGKLGFMVNPIVLDAMKAEAK